MEKSPSPALTEPSPVAVNIVRAAADWISCTPGRAFLLVFLLSFAVRGVLLTLTPLELVLDRRSEMGAIARSLAQTGQFANPYRVSTGPTAHLPPIHAGMLGLIYRVFGVTPVTAYVRCLLIIAGYSTMYALIPLAARRFGASTQAGLVGGLIGAAMAPQRWPSEVAWGWGEPDAAIVLILLLSAFLRRWTAPRNSPGASLLLGIAWGVAFHLEPALLPVVLGCMAFEVWWNRGKRKRLQLVFIAVGVVLACVPWAWRNYTTFHDVFFIRSNMGLELRVANHEGVTPDLEVTAARGHFHHPGATVEEALTLRDVGEMEYMRRARNEALEWIRTHPGAFLWLTAQRALYFWFGSPYQPWAAMGILVVTVLAFLGARRALPGLTIQQRAVLLVPLATFPLVYYLVGFTARYRVPVNWILLLFAGAEIWHWIRRGSGACQTQRS